MSGQAPFQVLKVQPIWVSESEELGSKKKFWYRGETDAVPWLFKYPQPETGQHWAEKIAAEVAEAIYLVHARVELAEFEGERGSVTESFMRQGQVLVHGNQVLAGRVLGYDPDKTFRQSSHTLGSIYLGLDRVFTTDEDRQTMKAQLSGYFVLDALIGNTDRHHENWGVVAQWIEQDKTSDGYLAPTFDHASSLGRELLDEGGKSRRSLLNAGRVAAYSEKARGAVFWETADKHALSPLELIRRGAPLYRTLFRGTLERVRSLNREQLAEIIARVPNEWMSDLERTFALELMCYNKAQLDTITL